MFWLLTPFLSLSYSWPTFHKVSSAHALTQINASQQLETQQVNKSIVIRGYKRYLIFETAHYWRRPHQKKITITNMMLFSSYIWLHQPNNSNADNTFVLSRTLTQLPGNKNSLFSRFVFSFMFQSLKNLLLFTRYFFSWIFFLDSFGIISYFFLLTD